MVDTQSYLEARLQILRDAREAALRNLHVLEGGIAEIEYALAQLNSAPITYLSSDMKTESLAPEGGDAN